MEINTRLFILGDFWMCFGFCLATTEMNRAGSVNWVHPRDEKIFPMELCGQFSSAEQFLGMHIDSFSLQRTSAQTTDILRK
jgi:hypothetical protein